MPHSEIQKRFRVLGCSSDFRVCGLRGCPAQRFLAHESVGLKDSGFRAPRARGDTSETVLTIVGCAEKCSPSPT